MKSLRAIPSVDKVLQALGPLEDVPRPAAVAVVRRELAALRLAESRSAKANVDRSSRRQEARTSHPRAGATEGGQSPMTSAATCHTAFDEVVGQVRTAFATFRRSRLQPVINGTGVVIHTNLGRAPLGTPVIEALARVGAGYCNLESDLVTGERGRRAGYLEHNLALLCAAEAATAVNNCAAALVLILRHFTAGARKEVILSRGELVQIGGGFRIPEILEASGAQLREVGTTNKTSLEDYAAAISSSTALILKVHRSNFFMSGFVESPSTEALATLARQKRIPFAEDLGSGAVTRTEQIPGLDHEPTAAEVLRQGADLVCFSGDKLLGGPQAGLIAGRARHVGALKRDPFFRALRCDKLILAALQPTVDACLQAGAGMAATAAMLASPSLPMLGLLSAPLETIRRRAEQLVERLRDLPLTAVVGKGTGQVGGGTLPQARLESVTLDLSPPGIPLAEFGLRLRSGAPPVIGYVHGNRLKIDLRTVFPSQDDALVQAILKSISPGLRECP